MSNINIQTQKIEPQAEETISIILDYTVKEILEKALNTMSKLEMEEVTFKYVNDSLAFNQMDSSRVCLFKGKIDLKYLIKQKNIDAVPEAEQKPVIFTVNVNSFKKALKLHDSTIFLQNGKCVVSGLDYHKSVRITIPTMENREEELSEPNPILNVKFKMDMSQIHEVLSYIESVDSRHILFEADAEKGKLKISSSEETQVETEGFTCEGTGTALYAWEYLKALGKDTWLIQYSTDLPMKAECTLETSKYNAKTNTSEKFDVAKLTMWIAPRMRDEEETEKPKPETKTARDIAEAKIEEVFPEEEEDETLEEDEKAEEDEEIVEEKVEG